MISYDDVEPEEPITLKKLSAVVKRLKDAGLLSQNPSPSSPWRSDPILFRDRWMVRAPADQFPPSIGAQLDALDIPTRAEPSRFLPPGACAVIFDGDRVLVVHPLPDGRIPVCSVRLSSAVDGPESVVAVPPPREIPTRVRELVRRHGRRG